MIFNKLTLLCIFVFLFSLISAQADADEAITPIEQLDDLDDSHIDYAELVDSDETTTYNPFSLEKRGYYCDKGYGLCRGNYCCPMQGQCCIHRRCCRKGYYCITDSKRKRVACCPNGRICRSP